MSLFFCSFSSGSSGNSHLVFSEETALMIDAGTTVKRMLEGLDKCGFGEISPRGILVTHEHSDHIKNLPSIYKKLNKWSAPGPKIYASSGTVYGIGERLELEDIDMSFALIGSDLKAFDIDEIRVTPISLSHDAEEPIGFRFDRGDKSLALVTDTGKLTEEIFQRVYDVDFLVLEANYERNILLMGGYPYPLKQRILSDTGHLSNEDAAFGIMEIIRRRRAVGISQPPVIALAHLSKESNTPHMAKMTVNSLLYDKGYVEDRDYILKLLNRDEISPIYRI